MKKFRVVGIGAGGHSKVMIDAVLLTKDYRIVGLLDKDSSMHGHRIFGIPVLGDESKLSTIRVGGFFVGLGDMKTRRAVYTRLSPCLVPIIVIHPSSVVAWSARIGKGCTILAGVIVNAEADLGANVLVNTRAVVEHDCVVGEHTHIAPGAILLGGVRIGEEAFIGAGSVIREGISIGSCAVVGAGSVVINDVPEGAVVAGNPAHLMREKG